MGFEPPQAPPSPPPPGGSGYEPPAPPPFEPPAAGPRRTPGKATASLVLGIVGLAFCPVVCSVLAIVLGRQAREQIAADPSLGGDGVAQAGFILGIVGLVAGIVVAILYLAGAIDGFGA